MSKANDYWRKREEEALKHYITDEREYDKQVKSIYADMLDDCQREIESFYGKYAAREGISIAEAQRRVSRLDIEAYERKAKRYVERKDFSDFANREMRLYNATMRINRLEMLKANIGLSLISGHSKLDSFMGKILKGRTNNELSRQAGILGKSIRGNANLADNIVNASFHNATYSQRVWANQSLLKNKLDSLIQTGLIQGKNPRALARELQKAFGASVYDSERLMRTELARVQIGAQKKSFDANGFDQYEFIANVNCCSVCQGLNGKHFEVKKMMPGENAAPIHPNCRCSVAAYMDSKDYDEWLDFLDNGGTTAEWNKLKNTTNKAKAVDSIRTAIKKPEYAKEDIIKELRKTRVGQDTIRAIRNSDVQISLTHGEYGTGFRGEQTGKTISIYENNIGSLLVAGQTLIHEMAHQRFNIGGCQHAEAICFSMEKMHKMNRDYLTEDEWESMKKLAIDNYPELEWEEGGYGSYEQFNFVRSAESDSDE